MVSKLDALRQEIDAIDDQLLALIVARANVLERVLAAKCTKMADDNVAIMDMDREAAILRRMIAKNKSVLPDVAIERIFNAIIRASREFQQDQLN